MNIYTYISPCFSCDTEGYYTTFHDFDGFQDVLAEVDLVIREEEEREEEEDGEGVVLRRRKGGAPPPPRRHSSLLCRESTGKYNLYSTNIFSFVKIKKLSLQVKDILRLIFYHTV